VPPRDTVLFASRWPHLGGAQVSLANVLGALQGTVRRVLAAPDDGVFIDRVADQHLADERIVVPEHSRGRHLAARATTTLRLGRWWWHNRSRLLAVHANGDAELKMILPLVPLFRVPIVVWYHSRELSPTTLRLRPVWRLLGKRITWVTVSNAAAEQLAAAGVPASRTRIVANPIAPSDVLVTEPNRADGAFTVGYLGCESESKGIAVLARTAARVADLPVRILCITRGWPPDRNPPIVNDALDGLRALPYVEFGVRDFDVRTIYARLDALIVPSLSESFCRIAAEAMLNGLPVVASDLPAVREVTGDGTAALLFPVGDADAAAAAIRRLVEDGPLREELATQGREQSQAFDPATIAGQLMELYEGHRSSVPLGGGAPDDGS
jgi:phosphatidylinositol alpha-mannosyltransferase